MAERAAKAALCAVLASACASYRGGAIAASSAEIEREPGWLRVNDFAGVRQRGDKDCGAAALSSVLAYYGRGSSPERLEAELHPRPGEGLRAGALADVAKRRGLQAFVFAGALGDLVHELSRNRPVIVGVAKPHDTGEWLAHYEVVVGLHEQSRRVLMFDPARGLRVNTVAGFLREWEPTRRVTLVVFESEKPVSTVLSSGVVARQNAPGAQPKMQSHHRKARIAAD